MKSQNDIPPVIEIPEAEQAIFNEKIKSYRRTYIRSSEILVNELYNDNPDLLNFLNDKKVSEFITYSRESVWKKYLIEEAQFNTTILKDLANIVSTPNKILNKLINLSFSDKNQTEIREIVKKICGEYAGRISPYVYSLNLSNTQSRRSRAGSVFQNIIYRIYNELNYTYDSQARLGTRVFEAAGLGKIVDSVLPNLNSFVQRRDMSIIGTMKTTLRERWGQVAEELSRTNAGHIYLLTVDPEITVSKLNQMIAHNITVVVPESVKDKEDLKNLRNVISFEDYFNDEIPRMLSYWKRTM